MKAMEDELFGFDEIEFTDAPKKAEEEVKESAVQYLELQTQSNVLMENNKKLVKMLDNLCNALDRGEEDYIYWPAEKRKFSIDKVRAALENLDATSMERGEAKV